MRKQIEKAIKETLVVQNKESIHYAVDNIMALIEPKDYSESHNQYDLNKNGFNEYK